MSTTGLGAALEQFSPEGWVAVAYASRFLNSLEEKYSVNELELLGVVWAIEHFKYYLYGKNFTVITDHQALISALNASERLKTSQSRLTRWIDRLIPFLFDIKHLAGSKIGLIDYISQNPVGLAIPPSEYDEKFVVASIRAIINNLEIIDNAILNNLANRSEAQYQLIKKRAKNKGLLNATSNIQLTMKHFKHSATGHCQNNNTNQFHSKSAENQSTLFRYKEFKNQKTSVHKISVKQRHNAAMSRKDTKGFKGGFIPTELKSSEARGRIASRENWHGSSDREESLSDPRWHKKPPNKGKKGHPEAQMSPQQAHLQQTSTPVRDPREILSTKKIDTIKKSNLPEITFTDTNASGNRTDRISSGCKMQKMTTQTTTTTTQTTPSKPHTTTASTQTPEEPKDIVSDIYVSRVKSGNLRTGDTGSQF